MFHIGLLVVSFHFRRQGLQEGVHFGMSKRFIVIWCGLSINSAYVCKRRVVGVRGWLWQLDGPE